MYRKFCFFCSVVLAVCGCERNSPSAVELKIDDDYDYIPVGNFSIGDEKQRIHKVVNNQSLFDVAYMYNIDPMNLAKINGIRKPYKVRNGQILKLPDENGGGYSSTVSLEMSQPQYTEVSDRGSGYPENSYGSFEAERTTEDAGSEIRSDAEHQNSSRDEFDEKFEKAISAEKLDSEMKEPLETSAASSAVPVAISSAPAVVPSTPGPVHSVPAASVPEVSSSSTKTADVVVPEKPVINATKSSKFIMPVKGKIISSFGEKDDGINIKAAEGTPVRAAGSGSVIYIGHGTDGGGYEYYGNVVIIQHDDEFVTSYSHLKTISVTKDSTVKQGDIIGTVGSTGDVSEPQLYFEVLKNSVPVNPHKYLQQK